MESSHQQRLLALWRTLHPQTKPLTQDEVLYPLSYIIQQTLEDARLLFYLKANSPHLDPLQLLPCPARLLGPGVFVYDGFPCKSYFAFEIPYFYYLPLRLNSYDFGYLFLESITLAFDHSAPLLMAFLAGRVAHDLYALRHPIETVRLDQAEASLPLKIERTQRRVWIAGQPLYVSKKEFIFLELLEQGYERGEPCPREGLYEMIYGDEVALSDQRDTRLENLARRLRQKLKRIEGQPVEIKTIRGLGYQLRL